MTKMKSTPNNDTTHTLENNGVTYEEIREIMVRTHRSSPLGDNDIM